ncbi:MAG TPA: hypothetical protein VK420_07560, partial [Longimicrobium sp.]|nr:hypothetical protein [Longimicrobium sp.]
MKRRELSNAAAEVLRTISETQVDRFFIETVQSSGRQNPAELSLRTFALMRGYALAESAWSAPARQVAAILGLEELATPSTWAAILAEDNPALIHKLYRTIIAAKQFLPKIVELLDAGSHNLVTTVQGGADPRLSGRAILTISVIEADDRFSTPTRLV